MSWRSAGIGTEERARRKALSINLVAELTLDGKETRAAVEERLGLPIGKLTEMCRQTTRKRKDKKTGKRTEKEPGGVEDWEFALIAGKGYDKGRGRLTDQFIFEFGLGQLVESVQIQDEVEAGTAEKGQRDKIKALLHNRHQAHRIFSDGLDHFRRGEVPWSKNGRRKKWANATPAERRASFEGWLDEIERLGCSVLDSEEWLDWFYSADPASTVEQFLWHWCDGWSPGKAPCPPMGFGLDLDYWENFGLLNSPELLDRLILVTESDMPYSAYHTRFEQPPRQSKLLSTRSTYQVWIDDEEYDVECDMCGDDIEAWVRERKASVTRAVEEARTLLDRVRGRRKNGGADDQNILS
ncbi:TPA: hypothetical protein QDB07_003514 [Burkholderia vietnamiensis]|nr:hypothetical protein [Burkholderia vietnamiensis]